MRPLWKVALASGLLLIAGCGSGVQVEDVSGTVTFAGQPVKYGIIEFIPNSTEEEPGPSGRAEIVDGRYDTSVSGAGVVAGPKKVRITAFEAEPEPVAEDGSSAAKAPAPPLFSGYTIDAEVSGGTKDFEVPESAKGFDLFRSGGGRQRGPIP